MMMIKLCECVIIRAHDKIKGSGGVCRLCKWKGGGKGQMETTCLSTHAHLSLFGLNLREEIVASVDAQFKLHYWCGMKDCSNCSTSAGSSSTCVCATRPSVRACPNLHAHTHMSQDAATLETSL